MLTYVQFAFVPVQIDGLFGRLEQVKEPSTLQEDEHPSPEIALLSSQPESSTYTDVSVLDQTSGRIVV